MAWELPLQFDGTRTAVGNYSSASNQFTIVKSTAATSFSKCTAATTPSYGVLQDTPSSGTQGSIMIAGITKIRVTSTAHAAISVMNKLVCSTKGGALPLSTAGGALKTQYIVGRALDTLSSNSTGIITAVLRFEGGGSTAAASGV